MQRQCKCKAICSSDGIRITTWSFTRDIITAVLSLSREEEARRGRDQNRSTTCEDQRDSTCKYINSIRRVQEHHHMRRFVRQYIIERKTRSGPPQITNMTTKLKMNTKGVFGGRSSIEIVKQQYSVRQKTGVHNRRIYIRKETITTAVYIRINYHFSLGYQMLHLN